MAWLNIYFKSNTLSMPVVVDVLIPQGRGNYKTLYLLHGAGGDHTSWLLKTRIADYVDNKNIAVIMPSGNNRCYVNSSYGKNYSDFISIELREKIESWLSVSQKQEDRYIAGMSMGGYGAFYNALSNPTLYNSAYSYSGLLNIEERFKKPRGLNMKNIFGSREELLTQNYDLKQLIHINNRLFNENVENATTFNISCGLQDSNIHMSRMIYDNMKKSGYKVSYYESDGYHDWAYWDQCIKKTIENILK